MSNSHPRAAGLIRAGLSIGVMLLGITACVIDPSAWPQPAGDYPAENTEPQQGPRKYIKGLTYRGGEISYFRTSHSNRVAKNKVRICLENNTGQPKALLWTKASDPLWRPFGGAKGTRPLSAPKNGDISCANFSLNQRVEFVFHDRNRLKKSDAMNLGGVGGLLVEFIWVRDY